LPFSLPLAHQLTACGNSVELHRADVSNRTTHAARQVVELPGSSAPNSVSRTKAALRAAATTLDESPRRWSSAWRTWRSKRTTSRSESSATVRCQRSRRRRRWRSSSAGVGKDVGGRMSGMRWARACGVKCGVERRTRSG